MVQAVKRSLLSLLAMAGLLLAPLNVARAQQQHTSTADQEVIRVDTSEILLDMVVRDKRGKSVRDLRPEEIEVYEDGVKQKVNSFQLVEGESASGATTAGNEAGNAANPTAAKKIDPLRHFNLITLVFDNLNIEARQLSNQAASKFLDAELKPNDLVAVFVIGHRLNVLQQFTNDRKLLHEAVDRATTGGNIQFQSKSDEIKQQLDEVTKQSDLLGQQSATASSSQGQGAGAIGQTAVAAKTAEITLNALQFAETLQREQQGRSSLYSLLALMKEQGRLVGRKTLIYFSEGLQVPPSLNDLMRTAISEANRANVSVYSVDARGLQIKGSMSMAGEMLGQAGRASRSQALARSGDPVTREQALAGDTAETSLRGNTQGTLEDLATSTGGFLIANTNDLRGGMQNIVNDVSSYYAISYTPSERRFDGKFHPITVKISRPGVKLQTRNGYFDVPVTNGRPLLPYEMPMLAALGQTQLPRTFEYKAVALHFEQNPDLHQYTVIFEAPLSNFSYTLSKEDKKYHAHFALMALIKDSTNRVVQKLSQDFPLDGVPDPKMEPVKSGNAILTHTYWLAPGRYTLETAALDRETSKISARRSVFIVPAARNGIKMSSIAIIKRMDQVTPESQPVEDPFRMQTSKVIPYIGEPSLKSGVSGLPIYLNLYTAKDVAAAPQLALEFLLDGKVVGTAQPELPAADATGRIPYVLTIPSQSFKPGRYEIRAVARQGQTAAEEHTFFTINP